VVRNVGWAWWVVDVIHPTVIDAVVVARRLRVDLVLV